MQLKTDVAEKYKMLAGHGVGEYHWRGRVLLHQIDVTQADALVEAGFPYLVLREVKAERLKAKAEPEPELDIIIDPAPGGDEEDEK